MIINHNASAVNSHRVYKFIQADVDRSIERLSSGLRINRAGDDPSGLAVSEKMRAQINGLRRAEQNTQDGISLLQTTEGYLQQVSDIIQRIRLLAIQSSNGIYNPADRNLLQTEVSQLVDEVDRLSSQAEFNRYPLLRGDFSRNSTTASMWLHIGPNANQRERVYIRTMTAASLRLREGDRSPITVSTQTQANAAIGTLDAALGEIVQQRANLGAYQSRLSYTARGLMVAHENMQAAESRIRDADMAEELVHLTTRQILSQSALAMIAHASLRMQGILYLLR